MHFEQYYDQIENALKNHCFSVPEQKFPDAIIFSLALRLQKVCD